MIFIKEIKVLIVDDAYFFRNLLKKNFTEKPVIGDTSFLVLNEAKDGKEGITKYFDDKPDLITLDLNMPNINGFDVAKEILNKDPNSKIIVISGHFTDELENELLTLGVLKCIKKPFQPSTLWTTLDEVFLLNQSSSSNEKQINPLDSFSIDDKIIDTNETIVSTNNNIINEEDPIVIPKSPTIENDDDTFFENDFNARYVDVEPEDSSKEFKNFVSNASEDTYVDYSDDISNSEQSNNEDILITSENNIPVIPLDIQSTNIDENTGESDIEFIFDIDEEENDTLPTSNSSNIDTDTFNDTQEELSFQFALNDEEIPADDTIKTTSNTINDKLKNNASDSVYDEYITENVSSTPQSYKFLTQNIRPPRGEKLAALHKESDISHKEIPDNISTTLNQKGSENGIFSKIKNLLKK